MNPIQESKLRKIFHQLEESGAMLYVDIGGMVITPENLETNYAGYITQLKWDNECDWYWTSAYKGVPIGMLKIDDRIGVVVGGSIILDKVQNFPARYIMNETTTSFVEAESRAISHVDAVLESGKSKGVEALAQDRRRLLNIIDNLIRLNGEQTVCDMCSCVRFEECGKCGSLNGWKNYNRKVD